MTREVLERLQARLEAALAADTPEAYGALAEDLAAARDEVRRLTTASPAAADDLSRALAVLEDAWRRGAAPPARLPGDPDQQARLAGLAADVLAVQSFGIAISRGDLSPHLDARGLMAGGLKALQASLRHLTWQTQMIARGDFSQHVDFMGEFSESFNSMVHRLAEARERDRLQAAELSEANAALRDEVAERRRVEAELVAANRDLEAFSYSISHDLRAPLRAIEGFAQMLLEDHGPRLEAEARRQLDVIIANARQMARLIDDLLAFSRAGRQEMRKSAIDMAAQARSAFQELLRWHPGWQVALTLKDPPPGCGDPTLMNQVWLNLLANALKFTRPRQDPVIEIGGWGEEFEHIYYVRDNGVGFEEAEPEKLFGVFQRGHRESEFEGTGVGLAIVHSIIQRHGGRVWAEGKAGEGATFYFSLPR